jgi:hypothetical protein
MHIASIRNDNSKTKLKPYVSFNLYMIKTDIDWYWPSVSLTVPYFFKALNRAATSLGHQGPCSQQFTFFLTYTLVT